MESGNEYVLQVKRNQPKLYDAINQTISTSETIDFDIKKEKNRGRIEERSVYIYSDLSNPIYKDWIGIKQIVHVVSKGIRNGKEYHENRYYISSRENKSAEIYNKRIRDHWGIENSLHWVKDKILNEDKSQVKDLDRSETMSIIRNIIINVYKMSGFNSLKYAIEAHANRISECTSIIYNNYIYD